ncbi:MAG: alpha/beta hydrolase [Dehalococcoidia bacterium]|nr:alpha/beta hydrolase [Dehalococcoidia bacterium]MDW8120161.1 alpha/beta hydrolase [Chloroflexota bacterium]
MADFLLVHEAGHGQWEWEKVWGYLEDARRRREAVRHPLFTAWRVALPDLPGHGSRVCADPSQSLTAQGYAQALADAAVREGLRKPIVVAHGLTAGLTLLAVPLLKEPPSRLVLVAGVVPPAGQAPLQALPPAVRLALRGQRLLPAPKGYLRLHREFVRRVLASDMDYPTMGAFLLKRLTPFPLAPFAHPLPAEALKVPCPVSYILLTRDRFYPPPLQRASAQRLQAEVVEMDAGHAAPLTQAEALANILLRWA